MNALTILINQYTTLSTILSTTAPLYLDEIFDDYGIPYTDSDDLEEISYNIRFALESTDLFLILDDNMEALSGPNASEEDIDNVIQACFNDLDGSMGEEYLLHFNDACYSDWYNAYLDNHKDKTIAS